MMNRRRLLALAAAGLLAPAAARSQGAIWVTYANDRFGTRIDYPADIFHPGPAPDNNDGRGFYSVDGRAEFTVSGIYNVLDETTDGLRAQQAGQADKVTYETSGPGWYVMSGFADGRIFYTRRLVRDGVIHTFDMRYDPEIRDRMDAVVARMSRSFGAG